VQSASTEQVTVPQGPTGDPLLLPLPPLLPLLLSPSRPAPPPSALLPVSAPLPAPAASAGMKMGVSVPLHALTKPPTKSDAKAKPWAGLM
jgi:hypothetical protein